MSWLNQASNSKRRVAPGPLAANKMVIDLPGERESVSGDPAQYVLQTLPSDAIATPPRRRDGSATIGALGQLSYRAVRATPTAGALQSGHPHDLVELRLAPRLPSLAPVGRATILRGSTFSFDLVASAGASCEVWHFSGSASVTRECVSESQGYASRGGPPCPR
jgi:hypothetical protein